MPRWMFYQNRKKPLAVSTALMTRFLDSEALIQRLLEEGACATIDKNQLLREAVVRGSGGTLTLFVGSMDFIKVLRCGMTCAGWRMSIRIQSTKQFLLEYRNKEMATQDPLKPAYAVSRLARSA